MPRVTYPLLPLATGVIIAALTIGACDPGRGVAVENDCAEQVKFLLDGGDPPPRPDDNDLILLERGASGTYSVVVGADQPTYVWLREPRSEPVSIPAGRNRVVFNGEPCRPAVPNSP